MLLRVLQLCCVPLDLISARARLEWANLYGAILGEFRPTQQLLISILHLRLLMTTEPKTLKIKMRCLSLHKMNTNNTANFDKISLRVKIIHANFL